MAYAARPTRPLRELVRVHKGVFSQRCSKGGTTRARWAMGAFRALVATAWAGIGKRAVEGDLICLFSSACNRARLSRFEPGEQHQIVRHHGGPDVGLEVVQSAPGATGGAIRALEA